MQVQRTRWFTTLGCAVLLFGLSGCFQPSASSDPNAVVPAALSGPTFTPFPTQPPLVTEVQVEVTSMIVVTATDDPNALPIQQFATLDPALSGGVIPQLTVDPNIGGFVPTIDPALLDPLDAQATQIVAGATLTSAAFITQTIVALTPIGFATSTPAPALQPTGVGGPVLSGTDCIHEVQNTDRNLYRISLVYGVDYNDIARASGLTNANLIYVGQRLTIPSCGTTGAVPPATSVPTAAAQAGGIIATAVPSGSVGGPGSTYVVQQGDTLFALSLRFGVTVSAIANANGISDIDSIFLNQELVIPAS
jgi:LysM repeat protein